MKLDFNLSHIALIISILAPIVTTIINTRHETRMYNAHFFLRTQSRNY